MFITHDVFKVKYDMLTKVTFSRWNCYAYELLPMTYFLQTEVCPAFFCKFVLNSNILPDEAYKRLALLH